MKNRVRKTVLAVLAACAVMLSAFCLPIPEVQATATAISPQFTLSVDKESVSQGEYVTVTLSVTNATEIPVTAFKGTITFNTKYCEYLSYILESDMNNCVMCGDSSTYIKDNTVSFLFNDSSAAVIPGDGSTKRVFSVSFAIPANAPTGTTYFSASVEGCYGNADGSHAFSVGSITQSSVSVRKVTTTTTATTTAPTTTTTTTTTEATTTTTATTDARSSDANLAELIVSPGDLSPRFSPDNVAYTVTVPYEVSVIRIVASANYYRANVYGTGAEPLSVGSNVFTVMVVAEDGTVKQYGIIVQRQPQVIQEEEVSRSDSAVIIIPTTPTDIMLPTEDVPDDTVEISSTDTAELDALLNTMVEDEGAESDNTFKIIGIAFAVLALFFFGFLSGYYIDKANKKREEEDRAVRELAYGNQNNGDDMQNIADVYDNPFDSLYESSYENQYGMNYNDPNTDYQSGMNYPQNGFDDYNGYN